MSLWEFAMVVEGYKIANGGGEGSDGPKPPTEAEFEAAIARLAD